MTTNGADGDQRAENEQLCSVCSAALVAIHITVDGNDLVMESCEKCDTRRWQLAGQKIDLGQALAEVGEHAGRRR